MLRSNPLCAVAIAMAYEGKLLNRKALTVSIKTRPQSNRPQDGRETGEDRRGLGDFGRVGMQDVDDKGQAEGSGKEGEL